MSRWTERIPVLGVLLSVLALAAAMTPAVGPDHLLLVLVLACAVTLAVGGDAPLRRQLVSAHHRSEVCRAVGVRSSDPDRSGRPRPRAPGQGS